LSECRVTTVLTPSTLKCSAAVGNCVKFLVSDQDLQHARCLIANDELINAFWTNQYSRFTPYKMNAVKTILNVYFKFPPAFSGIFGE